MINAIAHDTHHSVNFRDIFYCTGHMEGVNMNNYKFIRYYMKGIMDTFDPRKELLDLINFDSDKVVQVPGEILEVDCLNLTCMLCNLYGGNICFS